MTSRLGVELGPDAVRGVRLDGFGGRRARVLETRWDPDRPEEAVAALRDGLGAAGQVAVALRLPLLFAKRVTLPPLPAAERRRIIRLEPQRFFPVRLEELVVGLGPDDLVYAAREAPLASWTRALEQLGRVEVVEPGPVALARAFRAHGIGDAVALLDDEPYGVGLIEIAGGAVTAVRRLYGTLVNAAAILSERAPALPAVYLEPWDEARAAVLAAALPDVRILPVPAARGVPAPFLAAYGTAMGVGRSGSSDLRSDELSARARTRRRREVVTATAACAAAAVFLAASADHWRQRTVDRVTAEAALLRQRAEPALALQAELAALTAQSRAVGAIERDRPDPPSVLLALSQRLPRPAYIRALRLNAAGWQIDGYAPQAAAVTQALGAAAEFHDVRFLSATNRSQIGDRTYESFSIAFRFAPPP
jgi:hypothetical protein